MADKARKEALQKAISDVESARKLVKKAGRESTDPEAAMKLADEHAELDAFLSQLQHALALANDAEFTQVTAALKKEAALLQARADHLKKIIKDVGTAGKVVGFIAQAASAVAKLA